MPTCAIDPAKATINMSIQQSFFSHRAVRLTYGMPWSDVRSLNLAHDLLIEDFTFASAETSISSGTPAFLEKAIPEVPFWKIL